MEMWRQPICRRAAMATLVALACIVVAACTTMANRPVAPISTVVEAARSGASSEVIIAQIRDARTTYALRGSDFARLAEYGVPGPVLDQLQQDFFADVEFLTFRWYRSRVSGGPTSMYPQPLDLASLDLGGNGMAATSDVGRPTHGTRPPGVPEWVPPFPSASGQFISPSSLSQMTQSGLSVAEMVEAIMDSRVRPLYAPSKGVSSARVGAITGSMFASLVAQGVAPEAVDALQAINIADHVEATRFKSGGGGY